MKLGSADIGGEGARERREKREGQQHHIYKAVFGNSPISKATRSPVKLLKVF